MASLKQGSLGKGVEKLVEAWLRKQSDESVFFAYHRYPDTRAARGMIAAQPSDFLVGIGYPERKVWHLEVKETAEKHRLPLAKIGQYGKLGIWRTAGVEPVVLAYRSLHQDWLVYDEASLFPAAGVGTSLPFVDMATFADHEEALRFIFKKP